MGLTDDEVYKKFLKEYKIQDKIDKEYYRNSAVFASYLLRYRGYELAEAIEKDLLHVKKALKRIGHSLKKRG